MLIFVCIKASAAAFSSTSFFVYSYPMPAFVVLMEKSVWPAEYHEVLVALVVVMPPFFKIAYCRLFGSSG